MQHFSLSLLATLITFSNLAVVYTQDSSAVCDPNAAPVATTGNYGYQGCYNDPGENLLVDDFDSETFMTVEL